MEVLNRPIPDRIQSGTSKQMKAKESSGPAQFSSLTSQIKEGMSKF
jgi:hypothetical protein